MSICNVWTYQDFAIVATDTKGTSGFEFSKMLTLPHAGVILAFRGQRVSFLIAFGQIFASKQELKSFDDIVPLLSEVTATAGGKVEASPEAKAEAAGSTVQVVVVGWSDRLGRMAAAEAIHEPDKDVVFTPPEELGSAVDPIAAEELEDAWHLPQRTEPTEFPAALLELASRQVAFGRKGWPQHGFGGDLLFATLERRNGQTDLHIQSLGPIPE